MSKPGATFVISHYRRNRRGSVRRNEVEQVSFLCLSAAARIVSYLVMAVLPLVTYQAPNTY
jgi:hypothetical protein